MTETLQEMGSCFIKFNYFSNTPQIRIKVKGSEIRLPAEDWPNSREKFLNEIKDSLYEGGFCLKEVKIKGFLIPEVRGQLYQIIEESSAIESN